MSWSDWLLKSTTRVSALFSAGLVLLVFAFLVRDSFPALAQIGPTRFFTDDNWYPSSGEFNLLPMVAATTLISLGSVIIAAPLGIASAIFCNFYSPRSLSVIYRRLMELLAGIPSVVFGLWGLTVLAPMIAEMGGSGQNLFTAILILAVMILPTVALLSDSAIASVPREWILGSAALGLDRWACISRVVLPASRRGIGSAIMLGLTRALGETMAVMMVAGNIVEMPKSILSPGRTLNANIALELGYSSTAHRSVLFVSGLLMMLVISAIVISVSRRRSAGSD